MPRMVSPGLRRARYTATFACEPECGWTFAYDLDSPSCRLLNQPYDKDDENTQHYVIDGFILSPNVELTNVQTLGLDFGSSDHNPVFINVKLK